jgi:CBS domain containing-hemolysin-like protein
MGSSLSNGPWFAVSVVCGVFYLLFDAIRSFAQEVSPVTLRRWNSDPDFQRGGRWFHYDARNLQLMSGALLQIALIVGFASTVLALRPRPLDTACFIAAAVWLPVVIVWKFAVGLIPEDIGEWVLKKLIPFSHFFYYLFWPLLFPMRRMFDRLDRQEQEAQEDEEVTEEEVQAYIDVGEEEGILEGGQGAMIHSVVEFGDRVARELMTPRIDVFAFDARKPLDELARLFAESKYSRIPIFTESIDAITGIVHIKEVFEVVVKGDTTKAVADLARPPYFVSETKKVSELLREFQSEHLQVAVVVDEFGGTAGLITIEDVIEEIVGEIADEHEDIEATVVDLGNGEYLVNGLLRVETLEEMLDADLAGDDYETVAGLIFTTLGRVPKAGASVTKNGFRFGIERADKRRIYRVKVSKDPEARTDDEENEQ